MGKTQTRKIICGLLMSAFLLLTSGLTAFATDYSDNISYDGIIDSTAQSWTLEEDQVRVSTNWVYDQSEEYYIFNEEGYSTSYVISTVYKGEITTGKVYLTVGSGILADVYQGSNQLASGESGDFVFADAGSYSVRNQATDKEILTFTIVNNITGAISSYHIPDIYYVGRLSVDGVEQQSLGTSILDLTQEGEYEIVLKSMTTSYTSDLFVTIDHTDPEITLTGLTDNYARCPVSVTGFEDGEYVEVYIGGELDKTIDEDTTLTDTGVYHLIAYDPAGNQTTYDFTIRTYLNLKSWMVVGILVLLLAVVGGYMLRCRKKMRTY